MKTNEQLKEVILELRIELIKANIPQGHCPYAYYNEFKNPLDDCSNCDECKEVFLNKWEEIITDNLKTIQRIKEIF